MLFVAASLIKALVGLVLRYALFAAAAVLVYRERLGPDVAAWLTAARATEIAGVAAAAFLATSLLSLVVPRGNRYRFFLLPALGLGVTLLAARHLAG